MTVRKIITLPDPRLRVKTRKVTSFDSHLQTLINDMLETMYHEPNGVGLASTQIGEDLHVAVIDVSKERNQAVILINAEIIDQKKEVMLDEACLSVPGGGAKVKRYDWVKFRSLDRNGKPYEMEVTGLFAEAVQHELDHLDGKLYIDQLSKLKRDRVIKQMEKHLRIMQNQV
jgi:peptide deformylase